MGKPSEKLDQTGLSLDEIAKRSDVMRWKILELLNEHGELTIRELALKLRVTVPHLRNHTKLLLKMKCIDNHKQGLETFIRPTGIPYIPCRKSTAHKRTAEDREAAENPHMRVVRLLDREPKSVSKEEHKAARRASKHSVWVNSSFSMFDGW